jgi:hypothetical protein
MADFVFNVALGRVAELHRKVDQNDPANSALILVALKATGVSTDAVLKDLTTLSAVLTSGTTAEATNVGYARKTLSSSAVPGVVVNNTNDRVELSLPDQVWTAVAATGGAWAKLLLCYDPDTTVAGDGTIVPMIGFDFAVTPAGTDITARVSANGYYRAQ